MAAVGAVVAVPLIGDIAEVAGDAFGGDRYRYEMACKGQGRLVFAGKSLDTGGNLIWIIHATGDSGYRE